MNHNLLYSKTLPILFTKGYISTIEDIIGHSSLIAYAQGAATNIIQDTIERDKWLDPLFIYLNLSEGALLPLDYVYTSLFLQGMVQAFGENDQKVSRLSKYIGKKWWFEPPPVNTIYDNYSLQRIIFGNAYVYPALSHIAGDKKHITQSQIAAEYLLYILELFSSKGNIPCKIRKEVTYLEINFIECPFCKRQSSLCQVFIGIIEGIIEWLHGTHLPNAVDITIQINEQESTGHTVKVDVLPLRHIFSMS